MYQQARLVSVSYLDPHRHRRRQVPSFQLLQDVQAMWPLVQPFFQEVQVTVEMPLYQVVVLLLFIHLLLLSVWILLPLPNHPLRLTPIILSLFPHPPQLRDICFKNPSLPPYSLLHWLLPLLFFDDLKSMYKNDEHVYSGRMAWNMKSELKEVRIIFDEKSLLYVIVLKCTSIQIVRNWKWKKMRRMSKWWIKWSGLQKMYTSHTIKFPLR